MYTYIHAYSQYISVCSLYNLHLPSVSMYMHVKSLSNRESRAVFPFGGGSLLEFFQSCLDSESRCILLPYPPPLYFSTLLLFATASSCRFAVFSPLSHTFFVTIESLLSQASPSHLPLASAMQIVSVRRARQCYSLCAHVHVRASERTCARARSLRTEGQALHSADLCPSVRDAVPTGLSDTFCCKLCNRLHTQTAHSWFQDFKQGSGHANTSHYRVTVPTTLLS